MDSKFAWFYDVLIIAVAVAYMCVGAKRGLLKSVVLLCGYCIAIIGGFFVAREYSPVLYDKLISTRVETYVSDNIGNFNAEKEIRIILDNQDYGMYFSDNDIENLIKTNDSLADGVINSLEGKNIDVTQEMKDDIRENLSSDSILTSLKGKLNQNVYDIIEEYNNKTDGSIEKLLQKFIGEDKNSIISDVSETVVKPLVVRVIQIILFILSFIIISILVRLIAGLFKAVNHVPIAGGINVFLGGVFGIIQGIVVIYIAALLLKLIIAVTKNDLMFLNESTIEATRIFKYIYNFRLFK